MNNSLKTLGIIALLCFSFYYTNQFALLMKSKDPIYQTILMQEDKNINSVSAVINGDYIIPGLEGKTINVEKSFQNMKNIGAFNENYLVFQSLEPEISAKQNKDKIIKNGNPLKMGVAIILSENSLLQTYMEKMNIDYTVLTTLKNVQEEIHGEKINNDFNNYNTVDKLLSKMSINKNICLVNGSHKDFCQSKNKIMVEALEINNSNIANFYGKVKGGDIILVNNLDEKYLKLLIENIVYKGFSLMTVSNLISEVR